MRLFQSQLIPALACASLLGLASGCASTSGSARRDAPLPPAGTVGSSMASRAPAKDRLLWQYREAVFALRNGRYEEAKTLLDDSLLTLGSLPANDREAKKARGYFNEEARKAFRGEPYERVMAYYYRGILYWMDGEPDNARACFRSAQLQDSDTENREFASDYVLLEFLDGLVTAKLGSDGSDAFNRAQAVSKTGPLPPLNPQANALFFLEFGQGPTKYATGEHSEQLRFRTTQSAVRSAVVRVGDRAKTAPAYDDLNFQATTRGGRVMDHVLANKAVFKSATDTFGNAALISGIIVAQNRQSAEVGLGLVAAGLLSKIISAATTPSADTRAWNNLPQYLSFSALELPVGSHEATVEFLDGAGHPIPRLTKSVHFTVAPGRDTVVFVSDQSHTTRNL